MITPEAEIAVVKPRAVAFDGSSVWVIGGAGEVNRIDPSTNKVSASAIVDKYLGGEGGLAASGAGVWVGSFGNNLVYRVDPTSLQVTAKTTVETNPDGVGATDGAVWVAQHRGGSVSRIDPASNKVVATVDVGDPGLGGPHEVAFGLDSVWVSAGQSMKDGHWISSIVRIDPTTNVIQATIEAPAIASACGKFAITEEAVWTDSCGDSTFLARIDPGANEVVATIDLGAHGGIYLIDGVPWLLTEGGSGSDSGRLIRIDPASNTIDRVLSLGDSFEGGSLVVAAGSVWVADWQNGQVLRLPLAAFRL